MANMREIQKREELRRLREKRRPPQPEGTVPCERCGGDGEVSTAPDILAGAVIGKHYPPAPCPDCDGNGWRVKNPLELRLEDMERRLAEIEDALSRTRGGGRRG